MNNWGIRELVLHFGLAWYMHKADGGKRELNGFARGWLRRVRANYQDERTMQTIKAIAGARFPGRALLVGLAEFEKTGFK